jgi:hypothetical protein
MAFSLVRLTNTNDVEVAIHPHQICYVAKVDDEDDAYCAIYFNHGQSIFVYGSYGQTIAALENGAK